jgi:pilus assembly protein CpaE
LSLKGGVGVTTIATNMAALLQQVAPTILWDLSPNSGHAALFLGQQPKTHWGFLLQDAPRSIEPLLQQHQSGLRVLCAPPIPPITDHFSEQQIGTTLDSLTQAATFVIVDMPSCLDQTTQRILAQAHRIVIVSGDDPPSIQTTLATLQVLRAWQEWMMIIHNASHRNSSVDNQALQRMIRAPIHASLPYDPNQNLALRKGVPLGLAKPDSPLIVGLKGLIQKILRA